MKHIVTAHIALALELSLALIVLWLMGEPLPTDLVSGDTRGKLRWKP